MKINRTTNRERFNMNEGLIHTQPPYNLCSCGLINLNGAYSFSKGDGIIHYKNMACVSTNKTMTTPNTTPRTDKAVAECISTPSPRIVKECIDLETELNEAKAQLAPRNGHTFESLTKMWEDGHFFYAKIQSQLLTTQAECAAMRNAFREHMATQHGHHSLCDCSKCESLSTTAGKELLDDYKAKSLSLDEQLRVNKVQANEIATLRTRQEELLGIAEEAVTNHGPCSAKLTAFKEGK